MWKQLFLNHRNKECPSKVVSHIKTKQVKSPLQVVMTGYMMQTLSSGVCTLWMQWTNSHDYRSPVEKKGWHGHSLRERECLNACLDRLLLLSNSIHQRKFSFIMLRFALGDYFLQITKERMLLITSYRLTRKKCCNCKGTIRVIGLVTLRPWEN